MYKSDNCENHAAERKILYEIEASYMRDKIKIQTADIVYITHHQKGSVLHLCREIAKLYPNGNIIVPYKFNQLLELLGTADFSVPHNSYIVNLRYVSSFNPKTEFFVADGKELPMSRGKKKNFLNDLIKYMTRNREYTPFRTPDKQNKKQTHDIKYYLWLISIYLEAKQYEKIREVLVELQKALHKEETETI